MDKSLKHTEHKHSHTNFILGVSFFIAGLLLYIIAFFVSPVAAIILNVLATILAGYEVILEGFVDTIKVSRARRRFNPSVHLLMTLGALGAIAIKEYSEAALLILIFAAAHFLEIYAQNKSKKEISGLIKLNPTKARLIKEDGTIEIVEVASLKIGDQLKVLNGDQVPTDGVILSGITTIDQASITGESIPVDKMAGDEVYGATINGEGTFIMEVSKNSEDTVFAKILLLVEEAQTNISKTAVLIKRIEPIYVISVLIIAPLFFLFGTYIMNWEMRDSFYRTMVLLIGASPCALAVTDIPATLSAISNLAKRGVLFKGGNYLSNLSDLEAIAFDKTGTLTMGHPAVTDVYFVEALSNKDKQQELIDLTVAMELQSNHPLSKAILENFQAQMQIDIQVTNTLGVGLSTNFNGHQYMLGKPGVFANVSDEILNIRTKYEEDGKTIIFFAEDNVVLMVIAVLDEEKPCAQPSIDYFKSKGIHTVLITGDTLRTGTAIGKKLGIDEVRAEVLPEQKAEIIKDLKQKYKIVAMVGDGVNDAPALVLADIGVAMGEGTDIAIDVSDVVLMKNDLSKIVYTHRLAKKLRRIVWENIIFAMSVVALLMIVNIFGLINMSWAVFVHEGSTVLVLLNGLRLLKKI